MTEARVTVGIPTFARGGRVLEVLERILECSPPPAEIFVHVDASDGTLERLLAVRFPLVKTLSSSSRVGPGGGRHRCLLAATQPIFCSFDDDSWPLDSDYFERVESHLSLHDEAACLAAAISLRGEDLPSRVVAVEETTDYVGCGYAIRTELYRKLPGHVDRTVPYGLEERDLCLQIAGAGRQILLCQDLRVFHDTRLAHHHSPDITAGTIQNAALLAWLRYPARLWPYAALQFANVLYFLLLQRRFAGIGTGLMFTPAVLWKFRALRLPVEASVVRSYLRRRRKLS